MKNKILLLAGLLIAIAAYSQPNYQNYCFGIPELDFMDDGGEMGWDTMVVNPIELRQMLFEIEENGKNGMNEVSFLTPLLINNIRLFHPDCGKRTDSSELAVLIKLYNLQRNATFSVSYSNRKEIIEGIISDFKAICNVDSLFGEMLSFMSGGPYYGKQLKVIPEGFVKKDSIKMTNGILDLYTKDNQGIVSFKANNKYHSITMLDENAHFTVASFGKVHEHSLGCSVGINNGGDGMEIHLRKNGDFRFYLVNMF